MTLLIPEEILNRLKEFSALKKTGQIALNYFEGSILTFDVKEHSKVSPKKRLDKTQSTN